MRAVRLACLALFAEPRLAVALDCKGCRGAVGLRGGQHAVAVGRRCRAGGRKDGDGVGPVGEEEDCNANGGGRFALRGKLASAERLFRELVGVCLPSHAMLVSSLPILTTVTTAHVVRP